MATVPASSHGTTFNGGRITQPLEVNPATGGSDALVIHADPADTTNTEARFDQHGNLFIASGGSYQEAIIQLTDNTSGNPGLIVIDTFSGVLLAPEGTANTLLRLGPTALHTGLVLDAQSVAGAHSLRISSDNKLGFYDHAVASQQSVASGTVTPEQIALALQANGALGGT